jgi:membrane protein DedA with SNARE-associated domain
MLFIGDHVQYAHWIIFGALLLAGLNFPISEDLMLVTSGVLASTVVPENTMKLFIGVFLGCYLSDWIAYWLGRCIGNRIWEVKWFRKMVSKERFSLLKNFYHRYGFFTLLIGRFIPFGVRNCLFITAGITKMHFGKFIVSDGIACIISNSVLFYLAYSFGKNSDALWGYIKTYNIIIFTSFAIIALLFLLLRKNITSLIWQGEKI